MDLVELETLAQEAFRANGLTDWTFGFSRSSRQLGVCKYRRKRIEIAEYYARNSPPSTVIDTLYHEIAHALAGPEARHGPRWKAMAIRLGATPRACDTTNEAVMKPGDWQTTCPSCHKTFYRYKRPQSLTGYRCRCPARSSLVFHFTGDPLHQPLVPVNPQDRYPWQAICPGCNGIHYRTRRPKPGIWRCKCSFGCQLAWRFRAGLNQE